MKLSSTYEIMDPKTIGLPGSCLVMGKSSGRHAFKERLSELGYNPADTDIDRLFSSFKELADKKRKLPTEISSRWLPKTKNYNHCRSL